MRLLADTNIVAQAVRTLRDGGHDVFHVAERARDPGDAALLSEAARNKPVFLTKGRDIGTLVFRYRHRHHGVLLLDDLGSPAAECALILAALSAHHAALSAGAFLRATERGVRDPQA